LGDAGTGHHGRTWVHAGTGHHGPTWVHAGTGHHGRAWIHTGHGRVLPHHSVLIAAGVSGGSGESRRARRGHVGGTVVTGRRRAAGAEGHRRHAVTVKAAHAHRREGVVLPDQELCSTLVPAGRALAAAQAVKGDTGFSGPG